MAGERPSDMQDLYCLSADGGGDDDGDDGGDDDGGDDDGGDDGGGDDDDGNGRQEIARYR